MTVEVLCAIIGAVLAVIGGIWAVLAKVFNLGKLSHRIDAMEQDISYIKGGMTGLPCNNHHDDITKIKTILVEKYPKAYEVFSIKCSPRRLNELGERLYEKVKGDEFIRKNKETLFKFIEGTHPLVALDVEQAANNACLSLIKTPALNDIKDFVYNEPTWVLPDGTKYDITVNDVCFVIGLKLRDYYLSEVGIK